MTDVSSSCSYSSNGFIVLVGLYYYYLDLLSRLFSLIARGTNDFLRQVAGEAGKNCYAKFRLGLIKQRPYQKYTIHIKSLPQERANSLHDGMYLNS